MSTVELHGVRRVHDDGFVALHDIDLTIGSGEFVVVLGPSGCGKSTLLRLVAGLDRPTAGRIEIDGRDADGVRPQERRVAMVVQEGALYPHMTVGENLGFPLRNAGVHRREIDRRITETSRMLGLAELVDRRPGTLSGGQRQRVAIGRSLMRDPDVLLMDEPMSNLDAKQRVQRRSEIVFLHRRAGTTTIYVTHDQLEAMTMADRIVVMRDGRIVQIGTPSEVWDRPADLFVARFVGSPAMNLFDGRLGRDGNGRCVVEVGRHSIPFDDRRILDAPGPGVSRSLVVGIRPVGFEDDPDGPLVADVVDQRVDSGVLLVDAVIDLPPPPPSTLSKVVGGPDDDPDDDRSSRYAHHGTSVVQMVIRRHEPLSCWRPRRVRIDPGQVHLFDPFTGRTLSSDVGRTDPDGDGSAR